MSNSLSDKVKLLKYVGAEFVDNLTQYSFIGFGILFILLGFGILLLKNGVGEKMNTKLQFEKSELRYSNFGFFNLFYGKLYHKDNNI